MTAKQFYEQYLGTTVSDYSITTIKMLEDYAAIAIAEHEQKQWHKYPEEKPDKQGHYIVCRERTIGNQFMILNDQQSWNGETWITLNKFSNVIAWRELPAPYQPQEGGNL